MFGCLGRLAVLVLLAAVAAVAWFTRDRWLGTTVAPAPSATTTEWRPLADSGADQVKAQLAALGSRSGKAYVNVRAADLLAYAMSSIRGILPAGATGVQARVAGDMIMVRGEVNIAEVGGSKVLGPIAAMLPARDTLEVGGTLALLKPGLGQLHVQSIRLKELSIPSKLIPPIVRQLRRGPQPAGLAEDAIAVPLPVNIGDIRVKDGKITVYGAPP